MSVTTYYERRQMITKEDARRLETFFEKDSAQESQKVLTRRLKFESMMQLPDEGRYSICMMDFDKDQIYLEFKYVQMGITYKKLAKITKAQCMSILEGNVEWMAGSKIRLFQDFYRQVTWNHIRPGSIIETCKQVYRWKSDYICLKRSIRSIRNNGYKFFDPDTYMIQCLDYGKVELNQKQAVTIPRFIGNIVYGIDESVEDTLAYVL